MKQTPRIIKSVASVFEEQEIRIYPNILILHILLHPLTQRLYPLTAFLPMRRFWVHAVLL
jgi:hypothetical protein